MSYSTIVQPAYKFLGLGISVGGSDSLSLGKEHEVYEDGSGSFLYSVNSRTVAGHFVAKLLSPNYFIPAENFVPENFAPRSFLRFCNIRRSLLRQGRPTGI